MVSRVDFYFFPSIIEEDADARKGCPGQPFVHARNYSEGSIPPGVFVNIVHSCGAKSYKTCYWSSSNCFIVYGKISHTE